MALQNCRECGKEISTTVKKCPNCGIKAPHKKPPKEASKGLKITAALLFGFLVIVMVGNYSMREDSMSEDSLLRKVEALESDQQQEKYEAYSDLYKINSKDDYREKAIKYGEEYLRTIPVTEPSKNLSIYERLAEINSEDDYADKINLYSFMQRVTTDCALAAQRLSKQQVNNPSTYDTHSLSSGGSWLSQKEYGYVHKFEAANSFGVVSEFTAQYICTTDHATGEYDVERISFERN